MSLFPPRLIDELDDGEARRMIEDASAETAPRRRVLAALERATTSSAGSDIAASPEGDTLRRFVIIGAIAGLLLTGVGISVLTKERETAPSERIATTPAAMPSAPSATLRATSTANSLPTTSVDDLPSVAATPSVPVVQHRTVDIPPSADLLREANRLRAQSLWSEAAGRYRLLLEKSPSSPEAYPALVALADVELIQGNAAVALASYNRALDAMPNGTLDQEARWGRARSLRALGRVSEERAALQDFVAHHPDTPLGNIAVARLEQLGP